MGAPVTPLCCRNVPAARCTVRCRKQASTLSGPRTSAAGPLNECNRDVTSTEASNLEPGQTYVIDLATNRVAATISDTPIRRGGGGSIELEQMDSADPPLAVRRLHSGRHHQRRYCGTGEVQQ